MKTLKHTPGPWNVDGNRIREGSEAMPGYDIATIRCFGTSQLADSKEANARLISSAPELLAALKNLVTAAMTVKGAESIKAELIEASAAISKVQGVEK